MNHHSDGCPCPHKVVYLTREAAQTDLHAGVFGGCTHPPTRVEACGRHFHLAGRGTVIYVVISA